MKLSLKEWQAVKLATQNRSPISLDATIEQTPDCSLTLGDMLPDEYNEVLRYREEERQQLQGAMSQLEKKTQSAIEGVFLRGLPRQEVAQQIGVSPITVSRYVQRGVHELVALLQPQQSERLAS